MLEDLRRLVRLQELMLQADGLNERIAAIPAEVARLEKDLLAVQTSVEKEKASLQDLQKERRRLEMELMGVETKIQKYQGQLSAVKTNKEYQAILHEIEGCKAERAALDEKILIDMEEADKTVAGSKVHDQGLQIKRAETDQGKKALASQLEVLKAEKAALEAGQAELKKGIRAAYLDPFLKVARQRKGLALAEVREGLCSGCHVRVMPKLIQEVRRSTGLITCDSCKRYLYVLEEPTPAAGATAQAAVDDPAADPAQAEAAPDTAAADPAPRDAPSS
jgi:predicted  nucleic acid-binding Zn-ribbon protein